jgi:hypothetical protein
MKRADELSCAERDIPPLVVSELADLGQRAGLLAESFEVAWSPDVQDSGRAGRLALCHAIALDQLAESALRPEIGRISLPLQKRYGSPEVRYEVEAAIRIVPQAVSIATGSSNERLRAISSPDADAWEKLVKTREPRLVAIWLRWLNASSDEQNQDHDHASLLYIAAGRLRDGIRTVLA